MITGRVIRLFDETRVAVNVGSNDGVEPGAAFGIFTPTDEIVDPETGEVLGGYRRRKAVVTAEEVYPRFTIAAPPQKRIRVQEPTRGTALGSLLGGGSRSRWQLVPGELDIEPGEAQQLPTGMTVRVGDHVETEPEPEPEPAAEAQAAPAADNSSADEPAGTDA
jgi:hypothetical protein